MSNILVIYATDYGNTEKMAQAVAAGAETANAKVTLKKATEVTAEDLKAAGGIVFGTPVHMGSMSWELKKMIDTVCSGMWMSDGLTGKVAGVFASGSGFGSAGGGVELTLLGLLNNIVELGMIVVPLPKNTPNYAKGGLQWGPFGRSADENLQPVGVSEDVLDLCKLHGANIARATKAIEANPVYPT